MKPMHSCTVEDGRNGDTEVAGYRDACATTRDHGDTWAQAATEGHVWVYGCMTAKVCVDVCGLCCHGSPSRC